MLGTFGMRLGLTDDDMFVEPLETQGKRTEEALVGDYEFPPPRLFPDLTSALTVDSPLSIVQNETSAKAAAASFDIGRRNSEPGRFDVVMEPAYARDGYRGTPIPSLGSSTGAPSKASVASFKTADSKGSSDKKASEKSGAASNRVNDLNFQEDLRRLSAKNNTGSGNVGVPNKELEALDIYDKIDVENLSSTKSPVQHMSEVGSAGSASMSVDEKDQRRARFGEQPVRRGLMDATLDFERRRLANAEAALIKREGVRIAAAEAKENARVAEAKRKEDADQALRVIRENVVRARSGALFEGAGQRPQFARRVAYKPKQGAVTQAPRLPKRVVPKKGKVVKGAKKGIKSKKTKPKKKQ
jgi:hypothetical protein